MSAIGTADLPRTLIDAPPVEAQEAPRVASRRWPVKKLLAWAIAGVLGAAAVGGAGAYYAHGLAYESTDDAFVAAHVAQVSPRVAGHVARVNVDDNQVVKRGQVLAELDDRDYRAANDQAQAALAAARARARQAATNVELISVTAKAELDAADAEVARTAEDFKHFQQARASAAISEEEYRKAVAALDEAKAHQAGASVVRQRIEQADSELANANSEVDRLAAAARQAELNLSYTRLVAPVNGRVTRKQVEVGDYLQAGQNVLAVVPDESWVVANYKETQLEHIRPGQPAEVTVDAYPGQVFHGHVDSIQAGSGAAFSLLPPENATGNYVKIVQRVPVKITLDDADPNFPIGPGMSVVPEVKVK